MNWLFRIISIATLLVSSEAPAFIGEIDTVNEFPYVVKIKYDSGSCTGVAINRRLVLTAAHCLWRRKDYTESVTISYRDVNGSWLSVQGRKWWVPTEFKDVDGDSRDLSVTIQAYAASEDIGIIIPDDNIFVAKYAPTILDGEHGFSALLEGMGIGRWNSERREEVRQKLYSDGFLSNRVEAIGVGYGNYYCREYDKGYQGCTADDRKRWGGVVISSDWQEDVKNATYVFKLNTFSGLHPKSHGENPFLPGDSGGPLAVKRPSDSDWILVGIVARSNDLGAEHSSLLHHAPFIFWVLNGSDYRSAMEERGAMAVAIAAVNGQVAIAHGSGDTMRQAEDRALQYCRQRNVPGCRIVDRKRSGCLFVTWGQNGSGVWWQVGYTSSSTYDICTNRGYSCAKPIGACIN